MQVLIPVVLAFVAGLLTSGAAFLLAYRAIVSQHREYGKIVTRALTLMRAKTPREFMAMDWAVKENDAPPQKEPQFDPAEEQGDPAEPVQVQDEEAGIMFNTTRGEAARAGIKNFVPLKHLTRRPSS